MLLFMLFSWLCFYSYYSQDDFREGWCSIYFVPFRRRYRRILIWLGSNRRVSFKRLKISFCHVIKNITLFFFFEFNVDVRTSLCAPRLIPWALKLTTM
jgi:hypothetical protein